MKHNFLLLLVALLIASSTFAQDAKPNNAADAKKITQLEDDWVTAVQKGKADALDAMLAEDFFLVGPTGHVSPKEEFVSQIRNGGLVIESAKLDGIEARVYANAAVVTGVFTVTKGHLGDQDIAADYRFTDTFIQRNGKWLKVAEQFTIVR